MTHETPKQIAQRIKRGDYRFLFQPTQKNPGDIIITGGRREA